MGWNKGVIIKLALWLFVTVLSFSIGYFALEPLPATFLFRKIGYWSVFGTFLLFLWFLWRCRFFSIECLRSATLRKEIGIGALVVLLACVMTMREEKMDFRIVMDEHIIASTAKHMHETRLVETPSRIHRIGNHPEVLAAHLDKRPVFFQFLVSVVHDFTGYRAKNSVYLNVFVITPLMFALLYAFAFQLGGRWGAIVGLGLFISSPLLSQSCVSGGLQALNLTMILASLLLGAKYLERPNLNTLGAFGMAGVLLPQVRYESIVFLGGVALVMLYVFLREKEKKVHWVYFVFPISLIPYLWHNKIFKVSESFWELQNAEGDQSPFSFAYFYDNLGRFISFNFDLTQSVPNSVLMTALGIVCSIFLLVVVLRQPSLFKTYTSSEKIFLLLSVNFGLLGLLLFCYAWDYDNVVILRLGLPLNILFSLSAVYVVFRLFSHKWPKQVLSGSLFLFLIGYTIPATASKAYTDHYLSPVEFQQVERFWKETSNERIFFIADNIFYFHLHGWEGTSTNNANGKVESFKFYLNQPNPVPVYYFKRLRYNPIIRDFENASHIDLDERLKTRVIWEDGYHEIFRIQVLEIYDVEGVELEEKTFKSKLDFQKYWAEKLP